MPACGPALKAANGSRIHCWDFRQLSITVSGQSFLWRFLLADVRFTILGIDFLKHHQLVVDIYSEQLLPRASLSAPVAGNVFVVADCAAGQVPATASAQQWTEILEQFPSITKPFEVHSAPAHGVEHSIETVGHPTTAKFRRLDPVRPAAAKEEFQRMLGAGVVRRSQSCWSSPLHMVRKKDGGWRPCDDFRCLNIATADDKYPLPIMGDLCRGWTAALFSQS
jgi:cleavage and polyadenylation specificity factor subunit 1